MSFKSVHSLPLQVLSRFISLLLLLTLSGGRLALALSPDSSQEGAARLTPDEAIAVALDGSAAAPAGDAAYPEIGTNDMRLSDMGSDMTYDAYSPAVAYNSTDGEYLVVWAGDDNTGDLVDEEFEVWGQRVDAATGAEIGVDFRLSHMGPDGDAGYDVYSLAVAYNSIDNEYLVVWEGDDNTSPLVDGEKEIFGQRVNASTGAEIGVDFRLSTMGPDGNTNYYAGCPDIAYNSTNDEYLVVWEGHDGSPPAIGEKEIYGQRVNGATGAEIGTDFRLSTMGPIGSLSYGAYEPAVAYNSTDNEYLVVWMGDDAAIEEFEIYGQRVDAATGAEVGTNDIRLSDMGPDGNGAYDAWFPAVAYNSTNNEYLVVWSGDDDTGKLMDGKYEVFGQRVEADGDETGTSDFRISNMGPGSDADYGALSPAVAYSSATNEYLVVWWGDDDTGDLAEDEFEIFGQRLDAATGAAVGDNDFRLSDMGPDGDPDYDAEYPAVAYNSADGEYLVVWYGDDDVSGLAADESEILGQRVSAATGAEVGTNDVRLSDMGGDRTYDGHCSAVAYNSINNEYLVVWWGDDNTGDLADDEHEIYGQRVDAATGAEVGDNDFRISYMGLDGNDNYDAYDPAVAYNPTDNEYLVVWWGDDGRTPLVNDEYEIFGQRLDGASGDPIGANGFRLSNMGPDGSTTYYAKYPDIAYNSANNEYLVVWEGHDGNPPAMGEKEIYGQRVNASTGAELGTDFRLSTMGPIGNLSYEAYAPAVAYNPTDNEYLVVWYGDDTTIEEYEIYGQRVDGATGAEVGSDDFRLSHTGPDGDADYDAVIPKVAYNPTNNEYLVVWQGDNDKLPTAGKLEIYGQRVDGATGVEVGTDDFQLSDMGPGSDTDYNASHSAVAYDGTTNEYLVVWYGDDNTGDLIDGEYEIYGQRVDAATGAEIGTNDFRLSDMGPDGNPGYGAYFPAVAYGSTDDTFLVVWNGDDNRNGLVDSEHEVYGQMFSSTATVYLPLVVRGY